MDLYTKTFKTIHKLAIEWGKKNKKKIKKKSNKNNGKFSE